MSTALASPGHDREQGRDGVFGAWGLWLLALMANLLTYVLFVVPDPTRSLAVETFDWMTGWLPFMVFATVGAVIVSRRSRNVIGWLCCAIGLAGSFSGFGSSEAARSIAADPDRIPAVLGRQAVVGCWGDGEVTGCSSTTSPWRRPARSPRQR